MLYIYFMNKFDYLSLSGQHILVFVTLHEMKTVTATAEKLNLTQSAVSHSLQKMRDIFSDELFVRAGRSVTPTLRSIQLYPELKAMLQQLDGLTQQKTFNPKNVQISYKISANDYQSNLWLPKVFTKISSQVQSLDLEIFPSKKPNIELLRSNTNEVDMVISPIAPDHSDIMATRLFYDTAHCFYDANKRDAPKTIDELKCCQFVGLTFLKGMKLTKSQDYIIEILDENTVIRLSNFASIPEFIIGTDLIAIVPSRLSNTLAYQNLANCELPYQTSITNMYMMWHKRYQNDPQHKWFRQQMIEAHKQENEK